MGFDASGVGVNEDVGRLYRIVLRHAHLSEDVFDGGAHVLDLDVHGDVVWDVKSFRAIGSAFRLWRIVDDEVGAPLTSI